MYAHYKTEIGKSKNNHSKLKVNMLHNKKNLSVYLYGAAIIFAGIFLLYSKYYTFQTIKSITGTTLIVGALLSFISTITSQRKQVAFFYHEMHTWTMLIYGVCVLLVCNKIETLINFTSFLLVFYAFSEIIFCSWLFNLGKKINYKILYVRLFLGLLAGIGVIFTMYNPAINKNFILEGFGLLFIIIGINILLYIPIMKTIEI